jgi:predicted nuclease of predicted toxin-antitoxin system
VRFLLDEHISPAVADALSKAGVDAVALTRWQDGHYREEADDVLLAAAADEGRVLVTYDQRTIPPLLRLWAELARPHGGVVFIDHRTIAPNDIGGLVRALVELDRRLGRLDWTSRTVFLERPGTP